MCNRKRILSSLPLFTVKENLLLEILERNNLSKEDITNIKNIKIKKKTNNKIYDYIYLINKKEFEKNSVCLQLNNMFYTKEISYTYEEYIKHIEQTKNYTKKNNNYQLNYNNNITFSNITITITNNYYVTISKNINPTIHFVIKHPKLIEAIKNFSPLVKENI